MRRLLIPTLLAALAVPLAPADATDPPATLPWSLENCFFAYGSTPIDAARLAPYMPAGFKPKLGPVSTAAGQQAAQFTFEIDLCESGSGLNGPVPGMTYASFWVQTVPPAGMGTPGVFPVVAWDTQVPDADRRAFMHEHGATARAGGVTVSGPLGAIGDGAVVDYAIEGVGDFRFTIAGVPASPIAGAGVFEQWTPSPGGLTYWKTAWAADESRPGVGTIDLDADSWLAQMFGVTSVPAQFRYGTWDYTDGVIVMPS